MPLTLIFPAAPCQRLPEKSVACTAGGNSQPASDAGMTAMSTASRAQAPITIGARKERRLLGLGEGDAGIHDTGLGATFHGHRINREPVMLLERTEPGNHRIERRR